MFKKAVVPLPVLLTVVFCVVVAVTLVSRQVVYGEPEFVSMPDTLWVTEGKLNINTANAAILRQLPGVGYKLAARIVEYREKNGVFRSIAELRNVKGFSPEMVDRVAMYITVGDVK